MSFWKSGAVTAQERKVLAASSLGTVFEWYDFMLFGSLAPVLASQFFSKAGPTAGLIFALLAFSAGFIVRPFGALVFGRLGDLVGRKYTFLATIVIMGAATFLVGLLPTYDTIGIAAPIALVCLRLLQGLAVGGEYGGAAVYVAENAPHKRRGEFTSWIQMTGTLGLDAEGRFALAGLLARDYRLRAYDRRSLVATSVVALIPSSSFIRR